MCMFYTLHIYIIIFLCVSMFIFQTVCTQGDDGSSEAVEMRSTLQHYTHDIMTLRRERRERERLTNTDYCKPSSGQGTHSSV